MKHIVRWRFLTIPNKIVGDVRITLDERAAEFNSTFANGTAVAITIYPYIEIRILHQNTIGDDGSIVRPKWNLNDCVPMTKFALPIFIRELKAMIADMSKPDLYTYHGDRLELNVAIAEKCKHSAVIVGTNVEFSPVIIDQNDTKLEGIKMKFNNEDSAVSLTINEADSLLYNVVHTDYDNIAMGLYKNFSKRSIKNGDTTNNFVKPKEVTNQEINKRLNEMEFID